jgi:hypothetical protein
MPEKREYTGIFAPAAGLNFHIPSTMISNEETPSCDNVILDRNVVKKGRGAKVLGDTANTPLASAVMAMNSSNDKLIIHTLDTTYSYVSGSTFTDISDAPFTGTDTNFYSAQVMEGEYIFTNGVDAARTWDFVAANVSVLGGLLNKRPKVLLVFGERMCYYNYVEGGNTFPTTNLFSIIGDPADITGPGSGEDDLANIMAGDDEILNAKKLGGYVIIYGGKSIVIQEYRGDVNNPFSYTLRIPDKGLAAPRALINIDGRKHIFLGLDDIYVYTGGSELGNLGPKVRDELFDTMNPENISKSFMEYTPREKKFRLYYPKNDSTTPNAYIEYYLDEEKWSKGTGEFTAVGSYIRPSDLTWNTAEGTWDDNLGTWDSIGNLSQAEINILGDENGTIYTSEDSLNQKGSAYDANWQTKDFTTGPGYRRTLTHWLEVYFEARGSSVTISTSVDEGVSWEEHSTVTLTSGWEKYRLDMFINADQLRLRFRNNTIGQTFELRQLELGYRRASDRGN